VAAAVVVVGAGAIGYVIGHHDRGSVFTVGPGIVYATPTEGTAYLGADQPLNREPHGFAYFFPPTVASISPIGAVDAGGSRPPCVPYYHAVRVKRMEVVKYPIGGAYEGTVVWVQC
jgi:hypothetical protein